MSTPVVKDAAASGGDTPPATPPKSENPLFDALFNSAPPAKGDKPEEGAPTFGHSLATAIAPDPDDLKPDDKTKEEKKAADAKPDDKKATDDKKKTDAAPAAPVKLTRRIGKEKDAAPAELPAKPATPAKVETAVAKPTDDAEFEKGLEPEEAEQLRLLRYAAGKKEYGEKYKGAPEKAQAFIKKHIEWMDKKKSEDPDYEFSDANPEYTTWLKANKPDVFLSAADIRRIEKDELRDELRGDIENTRATERDEQTKRERVPVIKQAADKFFHDATTHAMPEEMAKVFKEKGAAEAQKLFPDEYEILEEVTNATAGSVQEYLSLVGGVKKFDPANITHVKLDEFIAFQCGDFAKNGGEELVQDGKSFVPRAEFFAKENQTAEFKAKHWTFDDKQIVMLLREATKAVVTSKIAKFHERQKARGWKRGGGETPPDGDKPLDKKPDPKDEVPPAAKVKPAPSGGGSGEKPTGGNPVMDVLGMGASR